MIHMTTTGRPWAAVGVDGPTWRVFCRCGWSSDGHETRSEARRSGDRHLAESNGGVA